ncbi:hypothetical protein NI17_007500 [Thermobifida halotolerans]|uniref:Uncharacterized protein n=2 Tax=Thermobifida halotolerans TaxID=483545 RepID=A0A399G5M8_9ACTN|nr:hypothetical protein [Thermobifida halotolerans]UOE20999.1 hypothetical protein NI17_007500 [Thermobifida halotolerans]
MIDAFRAAFQELIDASLLGDPQRFGPAVGRVYELASHVPVAEREIALEALGPIFSGHHTGPGIEADLTVVAGALVEMGTQPGSTGVEVLRLLRETGRAAGMFLHAWDKVGGGAPPDPDQVTAADESRVAAVLGESAPVATLCWWTARRYGLSAKTMLSSARVRRTVRGDAEMHSDLLAIAGQLSAHLVEYGEVTALLRMDEVSEALVLDRSSRRGFRVRFEGIGDNFQLHTLLADALIGEEGVGLAGQRPDPRWVAAFRDADPDPQAKVVHGWWNLVGADGTWVWNEGVPADIPLLRGERVLILEEQTYPRSWNAGRLYPLVEGSLWVVEELAADQVERWWSLVEPDDQPAAAADVAGAPAVPWWEEPAAAAAGPDSEAQPAWPAAESTEPEPEPAAVPWWEEPAADPVVGAQAGEAPAPQPTAEETDSADGVPADPERSEPLPATEAIPVLTDADLAAYDAARGDDTAEERRDAPGSALLPPLPPGVSDSSGWGPSWR